MKLYAICWRDTSEPWGWAPATEDAPEGALPNGPFFWSRKDVEAAFSNLLERAAIEDVGWLRERDQHRHALQTERYKSLKRGNIPGLTTVGVGIRFAGESREDAIARVQALALKPDPLKTDEELLAAARKSVADEWSIQAYDVPTTQQG